MDQTLSHLQSNESAENPHIYKLEVLKIMYKINTKTLTNCLSDFLQISSRTHYYPIQFATGNNYSLFLFNKTNSQRSIRCEGLKLWYELPNELKNKANKSRHTFVKSTKLYLKNNQN